MPFDCPSSFSFLFSILFCFFFFFWGGGYVLLLLCFFLLQFFPSLVFPSLHHQCYSFMFPFFACISFDCFCCCGFCPYSSSFSSRVSSSPQAPRALEKENNGKTSFCLPFGVLSQHHCFFLWFSFVHITCFLFDVLGISFEGVRDSLLFVVFCFWCLCLRSLDSLSSPFVLFLLLCFCLFGVWGVLLCFFGMLFVILGLSFLHCSVLMLLLLHALAARLSAWVSGLVFVWEPFGGSFGYGHEGGVNIFFSFSHNRGVWVKTGAAPEGEGSYDNSLLQKIHLQGQNRRPSSISIFLGAHYNSRGYRGAHVPTISDPPLFTFSSFLLSSARRPWIVRKPYTNWGFADRGKPDKGRKGRTK